MAVTRWTVELVDRRHEQAYRQSRFADDKRRLLLLMGLVALTGVLIFLGRLYNQVYHGGSDAPLYPPLVSLAIPVAALSIFHSRRTPQSLEFAVVAMCSVGTALRLTMLALQPTLLAMWLPLIVTTLFVIYLYLPVRFVVSVGLAVAFSIFAPIWWALTPHNPMPGSEIYRGILWLSLANALGFIAANILQRSQRMQYAQSLMLQQLLSTDALTGIANRRRFDAALSREWARAVHKHAPLSLLMIDVDHFKAYNDQHGHQQGDECLREVARVLVNAVHGPDALVARYGGEEFICLLPGVDEAGARNAADRMLRAVGVACIPHPRSPSGPLLTISIGAATAHHFTGEPEGLIALADRLLYAAKEEGRDRFRSGTLGQRPVLTLMPRPKIALAG